MKKLLLMLLMLMIAVQGYAGTTNYNWIYIPKYPDAESANYPTYMDNFMDDVDTDLWNVQQLKLDKDTTSPITPTCNTPTTGVETNTDGTAITWLNMTWVSIGDSSLREYEVRVKKDAESSYTYAYTDGLSVRLRPAFAGSTYYFDVRAIDKQGNAGSYCTPVSVVAAQDSSAPAIPSGLSLSTGISQDNNGISYVWLQSDWTANSEKDVTSYKVRIKEGIGGSYYYSTSNTNTLRFVNLKPNATYYTGVKAIDASGNESNYSTDSNLSSGNDTTVPSAASSLTANSGYQIIWLTWTASSSIDVHKYEIYRSATNNIASASKVGETPGITYPDDDLPNDATYYYWVRAVDDFSNPSAWSNPDTAGATATTSLIHNVDVFADISALKITSAELKSANWSTTAGSQHDLDDGTFYLGGSSNPKLSWSGTTLTVKGTIDVESGQTFSCATRCVDMSELSLIDSSGLPTIGTGASKVLIGNEGIKMFNASSQERVNINTDGTFRFGNSAGDNIYWNGSTLVLTGRATIATNADSATTAANATNAGYATSAGSATTATTASSANDLSCTDCVAETELNNTIDLGAGGVTIRSNNANNKVQLSSSGIYGYNTSGTQTFGIDSSNGNAYFGPAGNQISWDGSTLTVPAAKVSGALSAATISGNSITAGTITGSTIQTASGAVQRFIVSQSDNQGHFYDSSNIERVTMGQANYESGVYAGLQIGGTYSNWTTYPYNGLIARTNGGGWAVYGENANSSGGVGVQGRGYYGVYGYATVTGGVGVRAATGLEAAVPFTINPYGGWSGDPSASGGDGDVAVNSAGKLYYYDDAWNKVFYGTEATGSIAMTIGTNLYYDCTIATKYYGTTTSSYYAKVTSWNGASPTEVGTALIESNVPNTQNRLYACTATMRYNGSTVDYKVRRVF